MKRMKIVLLAILCAALIVGCSNQKNAATDPGGEENQNTPAKETTSDGVLNIATLGESNGFGDRLDDVWVNRGELSKVLMFRSLFLPEPDLQNVNPDLAKGYTVSDDKLTYTITMKDGLKWHDGDDLTAEDVVWSIETVLKAAQVNAIYTGTFSTIEGANEWMEGTSDNISGISVDGSTITIKLSKSVGNFIPVLGQFPILPKHLLKDENPLEIHNSDFWKNPVGNGMYKLEKLEPGNFATFVPAETYEGTKPKIKKIALTAVSDPTTAAQTGKIDFFNTNVAEYISGMKSVNGFSAHPIDILYYRYFVVNIQDTEGKVNETMADKKVREALMYGIDRKALTEQLYPGLATVLNTGVPTSFDEHYSDAPKYEFDPEKAKQLLKEANFDFNQTVKLRYYYGDQTSINFMTAVAQYLTNLGMKVDVLKFQGDATTELYKTRDFDISFKGLSAFGFEEWYGEYESTNSNFVNILGDEGVFDDAINRLKETSDAAERKEILGELQKLEIENLYKLPLYSTNNYFYVNDEALKTSGVFGNPWYNYDMKFEEWELK
jgi:peptide/nickel transport system substrate-binding protein